MKRLRLTLFSTRYPWLVVITTALAVVFFGAQFPKVKFDNDPENMLSKDEYVRVLHNEVKERYQLFDFVIAGVVNTEHADGIFNVESLGRIDALTHELISLRKNADGLPEVLRDGKPFAPDLQPKSWWQRILARVFSHDVNNLFDESGGSVIITDEIISPSVVDNIRQDGTGQLAIEYLMERAPLNRDEALRVKHDAMGNPLYKGTLVSEDGHAMVLYIPIIAKPYSYNVANLLEALTREWPAADKVYITGQPVAQDTFGVEMLVQMASSAPLAGLAIFLLLLFFFRRISLVVAPMVVAVVSVICTMGLLIGLGYDVHIMSSMIAIFLMPISVADSVHILSEFYDVYPRFRDKAETIKHVISHLFKPMLYTSLTTIAGFASLATTPIPPVRVFGLHVAFGVALAWVLTMTLVPAYIMLFVRTKTLDALQPDGQHKRSGALGRRLASVGDFSYRRWKVILFITVALVAVSAYGISKIRVNDNPVKWFTENHKIRVADDVLNSHFGGTYTAYLTLRPAVAESSNPAGRVTALREFILARMEPGSEVTHEFESILNQAVAEAGQERTADEKAFFAGLTAKVEALDTRINGGWQALGDVINYLEPDQVTLQAISQAIQAQGGAQERQRLMQALRAHSEITGAALQEQALEIIDRQSTISLLSLLNEALAEVTAPAFKQPANLAWVEQLQGFLATAPKVGKTSSAVDALKKASFELNYDASAAQERNNTFYSIPGSPSAVGQVFVQLEGMKKKDSLFHLVTKDYEEVNLWVQLKSGDNTDMQAVVELTQGWIRDNPAPVAMTSGWAGLTYLNVVWQEKMVTGMLSSLLGSFVVVLIMMVVLFRSLIFGVLAMLPLTVTITFIYGVIGLVGKDYDMPVAVLSSLTLGLSVDFAIHFLERAREITAATGSWQKAVAAMFQEPAMAISRNAIVISVGFTPLLFAPLVPYKTVGFFLATIMAVSWLATLFILAALITVLQKYLFKEVV
ncbi:MAG: MMPL family transporter [Kiritimatiellae bacterium]|nr:MMPL family transporter [Kiritimatiellia bacterium]